MYQSAQGDVYTPPYNGNTNHTGWKVTNDFRRQMVLKDGAVGTYSAGWALQVDLPDSTGSQDYKWNIQNCNQQAVGIATQPEACSTVNEPIGCVSVKTGVAQGPTSQGMATSQRDLSARTLPHTGTADNRQSSAAGGCPALAYVRWSSSTSITTSLRAARARCVGKVANIIGFFVEGMCKDVTLDPGMGCDDPSKDVVGRIVTFPDATYPGPEKSRNPLRSSR